MIAYIVLFFTMLYIGRFIVCAFRVTIRQGLKQKPATFRDIHREMFAPIARPALRVIDKALTPRNKPDS